tara:strand:- start:154 stop:366 length:213 start_codon:yes stop_codon:yes gene_type:complete
MDTIAKNKYRGSMNNLYPSDVEITIGEKLPKKLLEEPEDWTTTVDFVGHPEREEVEERKSDGFQPTQSPL